MGGRGSCRRHMNLRCSVCYKKHLRGYILGFHGRKWENVGAVGGDEYNVICRCFTCGHQYKSNSSAARRSYRFMEKR